MKRLYAAAAIVLIVALASAPAFAFYVNVCESRVPIPATGSQNSLFAYGSLSASGAKSTATPLAGWTGGTLSPVANGCYYGGDTLTRYGEWSFKPTTTGYYDVYATWANPGTYLGPALTWLVRSADADASINIAQDTGPNAWNLLASGKKFSAGSTYKTRATTNPTGQSGKQLRFDSVAWAASAPTAVTNTAVADGATGIVLTGIGNELTWTAGSCNSFFDVFMDTHQNPTTKVASDITAATFNLDGLLQLSTTYYWKVVAKNVDRSAVGAVWSFSTVPEPGSLLALGTGLLGLFGFIRRRNA
jgi:hypothetical protein